MFGPQKFYGADAKFLSDGEGDSCWGYLQLPVAWGRESILSFSGRELLWARSKPYFLFMSCYHSKGIHLFVVSPRLLDQKVGNYEW